MSLGQQYGMITRFSRSKSTMGAVTPCTWLNLQLLKGQKPSNKVEFWIGKSITTQGWFFDNPSMDQTF